MDVSANQPTLLIVDDEKNTRDGLRSALSDRFDVYLAASGPEALNVLESETLDLVLTDLRLGEMDGMELLRKIQTLARPPVCVMMTAYGSVESALEAVKAGAYDYVTKPLNLEELELLLMRANRSREVEEENVQLRQQLDKRFGLDNLIGNSTAMVHIFEMVQQVANSTATVLIQGESGTGKELVAHALHRLSPRKRNPFVAVHCAALSPQILESELFGHERGAFTGASQRRIGRFEEATGGTVFLDEIGEIDEATQVKLLRVLGERVIQRVGGNKSIEVDVRVVAATNKDLELLVGKGEFREDLYYRLNVVLITMPPLRERMEDVPLMIGAFIKEFSEANGKTIASVTADAQESLMTYKWPGNVRELRTAIEHAVVLARGDRISVRDLPPRIVGSKSRLPASAAGTGGLNLENMERRYISLALESCDGNRTEAAKKLGISRRTLHRKIKEYNLGEDE